MPKIPSNQKIQRFTTSELTKIRKKPEQFFGNIVKLGSSSNYNITLERLDKTISTSGKSGKILFAAYLKSYVKAMENEQVKDAFNQLINDGKLGEKFFPVNKAIKLDNTSLNSDANSLTNILSSPVTDIVDATKKYAKLNANVTLRNKEDPTNQTSNEMQTDLAKSAVEYFEDKFPSPPQPGAMASAETNDSWFYGAPSDDIVNDASTGSIASRTGSNESSYIDSEDELSLGSSDTGSFHSALNYSLPDYDMPLDGYPPIDYGEQDTPSDPYGAGSPNQGRLFSQADINAINRANIQGPIPPPDYGDNVSREEFFYDARVPSAGVQIPLETGPYFTLGNMEQLEVMISIQKLDEKELYLIKSIIDAESDKFKNYQPQRLVDVAISFEALRMKNEESPKYPLRQGVKNDKGQVIPVLKQENLVGINLNRVSTLNTELNKMVNHRWEKLENLKKGIHF